MADIHASCTPVGIGDLARRLGVHTTTVRRWLANHVLPEPRGPDRPGRWTVDGRPVWCWEHDVTPWLRSGVARGE